MSLTVTIRTLTCAACERRLEAGLFKGPVLKQLAATGGACATCGRTLFDVVVVKTMVGVERPGLGEVVVAGAFGYIHGSTTYTFEHVYELAGIEGEELIGRFNAGAEAVVDWISDLRKAQARDNLEPGKEICLSCGEIFTIGRAGYTTEGYCSPACRKKLNPQAASAPSVDAAPGKPIPCRKCAKPVKPRPGARCFHCGTALALTE